MIDLCQQQVTTLKGQLGELDKLLANKLAKKVAPVEIAKLAVFLDQAIARLGNQVNVFEGELNKSNGLFNG